MKHSSDRTLKTGLRSRPRNRVQLYERVVRAFGLDPELVIDLGAGYGILSLWARSTFRSDATVLCLDIDAGKAEQLRTKYSLDAIVGDVLHLPIQDACASLVILEQVIEHLEPAQRDLLMREARRVLKPGGFLFFGSVVRKRHLLGFLRRPPRDHKAEYSDVDQFTANLGDTLEVKDLLLAPANLPAVYVAYGIIRRLRLLNYDPLVELSIEKETYSPLVKVLARIFSFVTYPGFGLYYAHCAAQKRG